MEAVFVRASTRYRGRIKADVSLGDLLLVIHWPEQGGDGSVHVMSCKGGLKPMNWMGPGGTITRTDWGYDVFRPGKGSDDDERLEIFVDVWHGAAEHLPGLLGEKQLYGDEREMSDLLSGQLDVIGPRLRLVGREQSTPAGPIDILAAEMTTAVPGGARPVVIEVKRRKIVLSDAYQCRRYLDALAAHPEWEEVAEHARGVLAAPVLTKPAKAYLDAHPELEFRRIGYEQLLERA